MDYRHGAHSVFQIHLHLVWTTKYRKPIVAGEVGLRVRELIRQICQSMEVGIIKGHVSKDHVHLFVSVPPQVTVSRLVQKLKGRTSHHLMAEYQHLRKTFWGRHLWARGYFCCSSGTVTDEVIKAYIENQSHETDEDFRVEGEASPARPPNPRLQPAFERGTSSRPEPETPSSSGGPLPASAGKTTFSRTRKPPP
jgi:putative transposase